MGVEGLSRNYDRKRSPVRARIAALLALIPGMGAVYNRQNIKAVVHFVSIVGLFQIAGAKVASGFFALAGIAFYLYSIVDAHRTATLIAEGESASADEERFKRSLIKRAPLIGIVLVVTGFLLVLRFIQPFTFGSVARLFPVALILLGGYLLTRYFKKSREESEQSYGPRASTPPYTLVPGRFGERSSESSGRLSNPAGRR